MIDIPFNVWYILFVFVSVGAAYMKCFTGTVGLKQEAFIY